MTDWSSADGPLDGVRVVSFGTFVAGNVCALILAELGADVVKVESKDHPEALRAYDYPGQAQPTEPSGARTTAVFAGLTRSVRSISLDMESPIARDVCRQLVASSDVVVENLPPEALASWGLGFERMRELNSDAVLLSISGFGRTGPLAHFRAYASNVGNFIGLTEAWGPDGTYLDFVAGVHGVSAVMAGLAHARRAREAVHLDLAETEAGASILAPLYLTALDGRGAPGPSELSASVLCAVVRCAGHDSWLTVEIEDEADYQVLCEFLERPDLRGLGHGRDEVASLVEALEAWAAKVSPLQAAWLLQRGGLAAGPVQTTEDLWRDPQHRSRRAFVEIGHPDVGTLEYPGPVGRMAATPARVRRRGPRLGEHTREVLREWLCLPDALVDDYLAGGAVWQA